ncbi:MAG: RNA methyltransferase [Candidatus Cloacimonetes bacterium]|nr:RNA methyltransferase [Candidatus Cloacimonadota bacterium]
MFIELNKNHTKGLAKLHQKKYRLLNNKTIVEGARLIEQLHSYGIKFDELIISDKCEIDISHYSTKKIHSATEDQMKKITNTKTPQNIAAVINTDLIPVTENKLLLYLDGISDPGNLGTIFRTATAAGVSGIILSPDCCEIYNPKVIRSSLGSVFFLPSETREHSWLKSLDITIIATTLQDATNLFELKKPTSAMLVIGSEAFGVSDEILQIADHKVKIPIPGNIESMNAAVAAGIAIYHLIDK